MDKNILTTQTNFNLKEKINELHYTEKRFVKCGLMGWFFEVIWTGFGNLINHDRTMTCSTSLLMFPIYGLAALIYPIYNLIKEKNTFIRGTIYTILIFSTEFLCGSLLKAFHMCPWDYSDSPYSIKGIIRLDYAPAWFVVGLIYEKMLK